MSNLLTPPTLAVCYECFSRRDTWDDLADEYFFDQPPLDPSTNNEGSGPE